MALQPYPYKCSHCMAATFHHYQQLSVHIRTCSAAPPLPSTRISPDTGRC